MHRRPRAYSDSPSPLTPEAFDFHALTNDLLGDRPSRPAAMETLPDPRCIVETVYAEDTVHVEFEEIIQTRPDGTEVKRWPLKDLVGAGDRPLMAASSNDCTAQTNDCTTASTERTAQQPLIAQHSDQ